MSRARGQCCKPSSATITSHSGCRARIRCAAAARFRATATGSTRRARDQQRFVAYLACGVFRPHHARRGTVSSIASRHDAGMPAPGGERAYEFDRERRLAGAADVQVADDDDRDIEPGPAQEREGVKRPARAVAEVMQHRQRRQEPRDRPAPLPDFDQRELQPGAYRRHPDGLSAARRSSSGSRS